MMKIGNLIFYFLWSILLLLTSCEKEIDITLDEGKSQIVVDAFLTDAPSKQTIKLTNTSSYFKNSASPAVLGAKVTVTNINTGEIFPFVDATNTGNYVWLPNGNNKLAKLNSTYALSVIYKGDTLISESKLNPVPAIDSLSYEYKEGINDSQTGYIASFWATDIPKRADFYWIRTTRNDTLMNEPRYLNFAWDAAFEGWNADGVQFFEGVRKAITPFDKSFKIGDRLKVQLYSINEKTYRYLFQVQFQMTNNGLFAQPTANIPTNITNKNKKSANKPLGWFLMSAVVEKSITIKKK
ncbi:MAG: DUF4249 domain-containing protein [Arcicella sp.]|jgi:hypothetical protein|nr:DUF4249 domain-containing protein [Arcicella sp.]